MVSVIETLTNFISDIPSKVWGLFQSALNGISSVLTSVYDFVKTIPSTIWNLFKSALDGITNGISSILDFFGSFFDRLITFFVDLFVPKSDYWTSNFDNLKNAFSDKFQFIGQIDEIMGNFSKATFSDEIYNIRMPKFNAEIDFSWYEPYRLKFKNILTGAFSLIFIGAIVRRNDPRINLGGN